MVLEVALACGPDFPNRFLDGGDPVLLMAPQVDFQNELQRMQLVTTVHRARSTGTTRGFTTDAAGVDLGDLETALAGAPGAPAMVSRYEMVRRQLERFIGKIKEEPSGEDQEARQSRWRREIERLQPGAGLPAEFALYFRGAVAWHGGDARGASAAWEEVMALPPAARRFKSTWASYMLGRASERSDVVAARRRFQEVRALVRQGFSDSLHLAVDSLGREAKTYYEAGPLLPACELYLEQFAAGDPSACASLRWLARKAWAEGEGTLQGFAADPRGRRLITALMISEQRVEYEPAEATKQQVDGARWLGILRAAGARDVEAAEQLALLAYQSGEFAAAGEWLSIAGSKPAAQWIRAKLYLREGQVERAARLLAFLTLKFPVSGAHRSKVGMAPNVYSGWEYPFEREPNRGIDDSASNQILGELATLKLARGDYVESLDTFIRAGFWDDAAWIAERVLTLRELQEYVRRRWLSSVAVAKETGEPRVETARSQGDAAGRVRHLLARRLIRAGRYTEARVFLPENLKSSLAVYAKALKRGRDPRLPALERARELMVAARIARWEGLELMGTELEPDYAIEEGQYENGITLEGRLDPERSHGSSLGLTNASPRINRVSHGEQVRAMRAPANPDTRFHYRYTGADLALESSGLLPDNSDEAARILCESGSWLKSRDPKAADRFYKTLVRRCPKTTIGRAALARRWFPELDE